MGDSVDQTLGGDVHRCRDFLKAARPSPTRGKIVLSSPSQASFSVGGKVHMRDLRRSKSF